jgi:hypothetical protein
VVGDAAFTESGIVGCSQNATKGEIRTMGLDVYVGGLLPYFDGDWETEGAQLHLRDGEESHAVVIKSNRRSWQSAGIGSVPEAMEAIQSWRSFLSESLGLEEPLEWIEGDEAGYYTLQLGWPSYEGLLLWAAYQESGGAPPEHLPDDAHSDPVLQASRASATDSRYRSLLDNTEIWLPGSYALTFRAPDPTGKRTDFGFTEALLAELVDLNARTWQADLETIITWSERSVEQEAPLEAWAQFGFAILYRLAATARKHKLPMVLDY